MRVARRILVGGWLAVVVACGSDGPTEPGALTITLNGPPPTLTNAGTLQITGQVVRTPAAPGQHLVVTVSGGPTTPAPDTAAADGSFGFSVGLALNAENNLTVTATDQSGSTATPVSLTVLHDGEGPRVLQVSPATGTDGVTSGVIQVTLNEKLDELVGAGIAVTRYGDAVAGTVALSADSLSLTFTPAAPLVVNAAHVVTVGNFRDLLGNLGTGAQSCFVSGGAGVTAVTDPAGDAGNYVIGTPPPSLAAPDIQEIRFARTTTDLYGLLRFASPRSADSSSPNNISVWMDLDIDQNGGTGFTTFKDTLFVPPGLLPPSGARAEYFIEFGTLTTFADGVLVQYTSQSDGQVTDPFVPTYCGSMIGFSVPFTALGGDDGAFDLVGYFDAYDGNTGTARIDPAPENGVYSFNLTAAGATVGAEPATTSGRIERLAPRRGRINRK